MTKYTVHKGMGDNRVVIALDGYGPTQGFTEVGSFEHGVDPESSETSSTGLNAANGDHVFVAKAKQVLRDSEDYGHLNLDNLTYLDQASNAPQHEDMAFATENLLDNGGDPDPDVSTQLGGPDAGQNDSELENGGVDGNQAGSENRQEQTGGESEQQGQQDVDEEDEDAGHDGETVPELTTRIAGINDKAELERIYGEEQHRQPKARKGALMAIEARAAELDQPAE